MMISDEMLEKAELAARDAWLGNVGGQVWREVVKAVLAAVEPEPLKDEAELVERMLRSAIKKEPYPGPLYDRNVLREMITDALRVAREAGAVPSGLPEKPVVLMPSGERIELDDPRVLGTVPVLEISMYAWGFSETVAKRFTEVLANRIAALLPKPKTPEERVTISENNQMFFVYVDGQCRYGANFTQRDDAEIYRLGLIQKLKQEGAK